MTQMKDSTTSAKKSPASATRLNYPKVILLSIVMFVLIQLFDFALQTIWIESGIGELTISIIATLITPIIIGTILIKKKLLEYGWAVIYGAGAIVVFRLGAYLLFA